jgi:hypothetical protein
MLPPLFFADLPEISLKPEEFPQKDIPDLGLYPQTERFVNVFSGRRASAKSFAI